MMSRCNNPHDKDFPNIGGRGVKVAPRWCSYPVFLEDMGQKPPGFYMKRLDESADFEPGNVVWAEKVQAAQNDIYGIWKSIRRRCGVIGQTSQKRYKDRGVRMSPDWEDDFHAFAAHVGSRPSKEHTIDRIDNTKGYFPGNVRWALPSQQSNNRIDNVVIEIYGERRTLAQWIEFHNADPVAVRNKWHNLFSASTKKQRGVIQMDVTGAILAEFADVKGAQHATGISRAALHKCLCGGNATAGGYKWAWKN